MDSRQHVAFSVPGIVLSVGSLPRTARRPTAVTTVGPFSVAAVGDLVVTAADDTYLIWLEGVVYGRGDNDGARILEALHRAGPTGVAALDGSFNALAVRRDGSEALLLSDAVATRPWYFYEKSGTFAAAPTPLAFAAFDLPLTFDPGAAYETVRLGYTHSKRTLIREIVRNRPCTAVRVSADGRGQAMLVRRLQHAPDMGLTRSQMADTIYEMIRESIAGVVGHARLRHRPIHLPLTGGLDSRHILAELLAQGRQPDVVRHINIQAKDFAPAKLIAARLGLPTNFKEIEEVDHPQVLRHWALRSGGLVNAHQSYLLDMFCDLPEGGVVGFDGYAMDFLLSVQTKTNLNATGQAVDTVFDRTYTNAPVLAALFPNHRAFDREARALLTAESADYHGNEWFKMGMMDLFHRSTKYTGSAFPLFGDGALYFGPGAVSRAVDFFCTANPDESIDTRARLVLMKRYYPELSALPGKHGVPYAEIDEMIEHYPSKAQYVWWLLRSFATFGRIDAVPEGEHRWIRRIPDLRRVHEWAVRDSWLARDGLIDRRGLALSWNLLRLGGYEGWTLFSILSLEVAYRLLCHRVPPTDLPFFAE